LISKVFHTPLKPPAQLNMKELLFIDGMELKVDAIAVVEIKDGP